MGISCFFSKYGGLKRLKEASAKLASLHLCLLTFILSISLSFVACQKDSPDPMVEAPPPGPVQYGIPFTKVPDIADINLYEVNTRVFSTSKNLDGITARLDSLKKLGINVVWLMPIYQTGSLNSVGSPYAIKNFKAIHTDFGTLADLRELSDKAHALDMAVMLDWVANHTSWDNNWITNKVWYAQDANGNIIQPPGTNWQDVAELNYENTKMRQEMIASMKYWVLEANVDGFRCDYAAGVPSGFWKQAIDTLRNIPNRKLILFAEAEDKNLLSAGFDLLFGWPFYTALKEVFNGQPASQLYNTHLQEYNGLAPGKHIVRWITNHDQHAWDAVPQSIFKSNAGAVAAFVIAANMGGIPLTYNGQEVMVPQKLPFFEGNNVSINWNQNPGIRLEHEKILNFRQQSSALRNGTLTDFSTNDISAFTRKAGNEEVLVLVNVRNAASNFALPAELANSTWTNAYNGSAVNLGTHLNLTPFEYLVLKK